MEGNLQYCLSRISHSLAIMFSLSYWHLRLVVQRTKIDTKQGEQFLPGMEYMYRAILTNDHNSIEEQIIDKYNQ